MVIAPASRAVELAARIQRVSDRLAAASPSFGGLEVSKAASQLVVNNQ
jgi:hypothetical protein